MLVEYIYPRFLPYLAIIMHQQEYLGGIKMSRKIISLLLTAMLILLFIFPASAQLADTPCLMFHHDLNHNALADTTHQETVGAPLPIYVPDNYTTIQAAVDNAIAGDTIIVRDGTYSENVDVNKQLTIQSENGADKTIVQTVDSNDHVFEVTADYVNISGFTVKGGLDGRQEYILEV